MFTFFLEYSTNSISCNFSISPNNHFLRHSFFLSKIAYFPVSCNYRHNIIYYTTKNNKNVLNVIINAIYVTFGKIVSLCVIYWSIAFRVSRFVNEFHILKSTFNFRTQNSTIVMTFPFFTCFLWYNLW